MDTSGLNTDDFSDILKIFSSVTAKPEQFLSFQTAASKQIKTSTKQLYDLTKKCEGKVSVRDDALPQLIVENFDDEQIWQEIELQNAPILENLVGNIANSLAAKRISFQGGHGINHGDEIDKSQLNQDDDEEVNDGEEYEEEEDDSDLDGDFKLSDGSRLGFQDVDSDEESEEEKEMKKILKKAVEENEEEEDSKENDEDLQAESDENDSETEVPDKTNKMKTSDSSKSKGTPKRKTIVDDNFFRLSDMEAFLEKEDAKEERKIRIEKGDDNENSEDSDDEDEEEEIDMFEDMSSSEEEEEKNESTANDFKYEEFFDPPDEEAKKAPAKSQKKSQKKKESHDEELEDEDDENSIKEEMEEEDDEEEEEETKSVSKSKDLFAESDSEGEDVADIFGGNKEKQSTFEKRQERLNSQIGKMEDASIAEKPWQLKGEVGAKARPENSLLSEYLDFEHTTKQAPAITEETTKQLEDVIKQRIKDKAFDDVERKNKPKDEPFEFKKRVVLDQEKSKMSLSQIYEQEYIKQTEKDEEEKEDPQHEDIKKMMTSLFVKLDALSNFHYNPKPAAPEVKIVSNLPSISMEEVAPVTTNDATLLAPEEIQGKPKGEIKGTTERDDTDKKRERRDKKARQRTRRKAKEQKQKLIEKLKPGLGNKFAKEKAMKDLEKQSLVKKSGVTVLKENAPSKKLGSGQFFTQLQEEVTSHIQSRKADKKKQKDKNKTSAKLKL